MVSFTSGAGRFKKKKDMWHYEMTIDWKSLSKKKHRYECFLAIALDLCNKILDQFWTINTIILSPPGSSNSKIPPPSPPLPERMSGSEHLASEDRASNSITPNSVEVLSPPCQTSNHKNRPRWNPRNFSAISVHTYMASSQKWRRNFKFHMEVESFVSREYSWLFLQTFQKNPRNKWSEDH